MKNLSFIFFLALCLQSAGQSLKIKIDSLLLTKPAEPFNGVILISQNGKTIYSKTQGYSNLDKKIILQENDEFVIGSISKQFTAVMVLREIEKGKIELFVPIRNYLPGLKMGWADTVNVHQLLTHTHGIVSLYARTLFVPGTQYDYSQLGYDLLAQILERVTGKSFIEISADLFKYCKMQHSFHPDNKKYRQLVKAYTKGRDGQFKFDSLSLENYAAAGAFISTANDLILWNNYLHGGKLLNTKSYELMMTPKENAIRNHPFFGTTPYGYGITINNVKNPIVLGQTGFASGFVSMDYYFPESTTSVVVLENVTYNRSELVKSFYYHLELLDLLKRTMQK